MARRQESLLTFVISKLLRGSPGESGIHRTGLTFIVVARRSVIDKLFVWTATLFLIINPKMPAGTFERTSPSAVAATPASGDSTPEKPRTLPENRKVGYIN